MIPQDKIIEWAREVNAHRYTNRNFPDHPAFAFDIERLTNFANLVAQHQKEQDARICVEIEKHLGIASECAAAIRSQE